MSKSHTDIPAAAAEAPVSPTPTLADEKRTSAPPESPLGNKWRKIALIITFSLAEFMDAFNNSALFPGVPAISEALNMRPNETTWLFAAYQATFAAFLLISGRISDVYHPKPTFIVGASLLGFMSLGSGFVKNKVGMFILRAIAGIGGALTIPSALNLIVQLFPDPQEQARAIAMFGASGAIGNVTGLLIGAIFVQLATWHWIFYFVTMVCIPIAIAALILVPALPGQPKSTKVDGETEVPAASGLDLIGVFFFTSALLLFIYALTSGAANGWGSASVLTTLILSIVLIVVFQLYETFGIAEHLAALPPSIWKLPNFTILIVAALLPFCWWLCVFLVYSPLWQEIYRWNAIMTAVRFLPIGIVAFPVAMITPVLPKYVHPRWIILSGLVLTFIGTMLYPFADRQSRYWGYNFPAFLIGSTGCMTVYSSTNIAIFRNAPPRIAGTVGAVFNAALQLGGAIGVAVFTSIQTSVDKKKSHGLSETGVYTGYSGRAAAWWFIVALVVLTTVAIAVFYKPENELVDDIVKEQVDAKAAQESDLEAAAKRTDGEREKEKSKEKN